MKGVDALIATVFIIMISIVGIAIVLESSQPSVERTQEIGLMKEGKSVLTQIDNAVRDVAQEGEGSTRTLQLSISGGSYFIDGDNDAVTFFMDSTSQIVGEGISQKEDNINVFGGKRAVYMNISYSNMNIINEERFGKGYRTLTIRNNGYNTQTKKQMIYISLTPIQPTMITFSKSYNQTQTLVIIGTSTTSPDNLNLQDGQTHNVIESVVLADRVDSSSDLESGVKQLNDSSTFNLFFYEPANSISAAIWDNIVDGDWVSTTTSACNGTSFRDALAGLSNLRSKNLMVNTIGYSDIQLNATVRTGSGLDNGEYIRIYTYDGSVWTQQYSSRSVTSCTVRNLALDSSYDDNANFAMNFSCNHNAQANEWCVVDDIRLSGYSIKTEENTSYSTYNDISIDNLYSTLVNITIKVNVSYYNNAGSNGKNSDPDLWLEMYNGSSWIEVGNMSVNGLGNFSIMTTIPSILSSWTNQNNRDIRIKGRYFDTNMTAQDNINYTDVWIEIGSERTNYVVDIEHNTTGVSWPGTLNNISVSLNFSTNVTTAFNFLIYNFLVEDWEICDALNPVANTWYLVWCNETDPSHYLSSGTIMARLNETSHQNLAEIKEDYIQYYITYIQ